jgi:hypothetical protein
MHFNEDGSGPGKVCVGMAIVLKIFVTFRMQIPILKLTDIN